MPVPNSGEKYKPPVQRRDRMQVGDSRGKASQFWSRDSVNGNVKHAIYHFKWKFPLPFGKSPKSWFFVTVKKGFVRFSQSETVFSLHCLSLNGICPLPLSTHRSCSLVLICYSLLACRLLMCLCLSFACMLSYCLLSLIVRLHDVSMGEALINLNLTQRTA